MLEEVSIKGVAQKILGLVGISLLSLIVPLLDPTLSDNLVKLFVAPSIIIGIITIIVYLLQLKFSRLHRVFHILVLLLLMYNFTLIGLFPFSIAFLILAFSCILLGGIIPFISIKATWFFYTLGGAFPLPSNLYWIQEQALVQKTQVSKVKDIGIILFLCILAITNIAGLFLSPVSIDQRLLILKIVVLFVAFGLALWGGVYVRGSQGKTLPLLLRVIFVLIAISVTTFSASSYFLPQVVPTIIFSQAEKAYEAKKDTQAIIKYEDLVKNYPDFVRQNPNIYYHLGVSYLTQKKPYKASASFSRFLESNPSQKTLTPEAHFLIGLTFADTQKYYQAIQELEKVAQSDLRKTDQPLYQITLAEAYFGKRKFDKALVATDKTLRQVDGKSPYKRKAHLIRYLIFLEQEKDVQALKEIAAFGRVGLNDLDLFEISYFYEGQLSFFEQMDLLKVWSDLQASEIDNHSKAIYYTIWATFYNSKGEYKKALEYSQKATHLDPDYLPAYYTSGITYVNTKEYQKALEYDKKALEIDENDPLVRNAAGWTYYNIARTNDYNPKQIRIAQEHLKKSIALDPEFAMAHNNLGLTFYVLKKYDDALNSFQTSIHLDPQYKKPYLNIGSTYVEQKQYEKALEYYEKVLKIDSEYVQAYYGIADLYFRQKNYEQAIQNLRKVQALDKNYLDAYEVLAENYMALQQPQKAIAELNNGIKIDPKHGGFYIALANIYKDLGETQKSEELFKKGVSLQPKSTGAYYYNNALLLKRAGKLKEAILELEKALQHLPDDIPTYIALGQLYGDTKNYQKAVEILEKALSIDPKNLDIYDSLGTAYTEKGNYQAAITTYNKGLTLKLDEQDPSGVARTYENLGLVYFNHTKQIDLAEEAFKNALKYDASQATVYINLGVTYQTKGLVEASIDQYRTALKLDPNDAQTHNNLGYSLALQGNLNEAIAEFKKALEIDPNLKIAKENLNRYQNKR